MNNCCKNTDKEIWRQTLEDYYSPSIHVTEQGAIGIKCGGHVIVATVQAWHNWGKEALLDAVDHAVPAEPPKPTGEPVKHYICKGCKDARAGDEACLSWKLCQVAEPFGNGMHRYRRRLWTPMPAPQPALMICNHARECKFVGCHHAAKHLRQDACKALCQNKDGGIAGSVCVPWVEPAKHWTCDGCHHEHSAAESQRCAACRDYDDINDAGQVYHRFWTPAQPEPDAPVNRPCSTCGWMVGGLCGCTIACDGDQWKPRKPKAAPGLVKYDIKKTNEHIGDLAQWICPFGYLPDLAGFVDFDHIELKSGATVTTLGAFPKDDPPVRAWFCVANNSRSS